MTMQEFVAAAEALCPDQDRALFVDESHRNYPCEPTGWRTAVRYQIWDGALKQIFQSDDPALALALYRIAVAPPTHARKRSPGRRGRHLPTDPLKGPR